MQKRLKIGLIVLMLAAVLSGVVIGELLLSKQITTSIIVKPEVSMGVFDTDGETPLTHIDFGQFAWGSEYYFPGHLSDPPMQYYFINNTDQQSFYVCFYMTGMPGISNGGCSVYIKRGDESTFKRFDLGESASVGIIYEFPIESEIVNPDPATQYAIFYIKMTVWSGTPFDTYTPTLYVNAYDTATG